MNQYQEHIPIIAFDGNHRSGKGTQINTLESRLRKDGLHPHVLRGDGSRPGMGESEWWQNFKLYVRKFENEYDAWRTGACRLMAEAAIVRMNIISDPEAVILFDRSNLSRTQMALKEGIEPIIENMYSDVNGSIIREDIISSLRPDLIVYLDLPISILSKRLDINDPKYDFRHNNIINSNGYYKEAFKILKNNNENIICIDGDQGSEIVGDIIFNAIIRQNILN